MDLGIKDKKAIVCAASKGLGKACAMSLARSGVDLVINSRTASELEATATEIRSATGCKVTTVAADITTPEGRAKVLAACPDPDILVNNAGGPPRGDFRERDGTGSRRDSFFGRSIRKRAHERFFDSSFYSMQKANRCNSAI
jgi:3-oxoacyl-[acyl-carrier protein] reductase